MIFEIFMSIVGIVRMESLAERKKLLILYMKFHK